MPDLYIIVHEEILREKPEYDSDVIKVLAEIDRIKKDEKFLVIPKNKNPIDLVTGMPRLSQGLVVRVVGTSKRICCAKQLYTLRKNGYTANFHGPGCYDNGIVSADVRNLHGADYYVPEIFD